MLVLCVFLVVYHEALTFKVKLSSVACDVQISSFFCLVYFSVTHKTVRTLFVCSYQKMRGKTDDAVTALFNTVKLQIKLQKLGNERADRERG